MRLRFTIRDLLWLTVVAALGVGWWLDHKALWEQTTEYKFMKALEEVDKTTVPFTGEIPSLPSAEYWESLNARKRKLEK